MGLLEENLVHRKDKVKSRHGFLSGSPSIGIEHQSKISVVPTSYCKAWTVDLPFLVRFTILQECGHLI
jgi:hypothetical protein